MIILGLDPGTRLCGYCVLEIKNSNFKIHKVGSWDLMDKDPKRALGERLEFLSDEITKLLKAYNPQIVGLEKAVAFKNIPSALTLSEARGVLRLKIYEHLSEACKRLVELSPTEIKRVTTGSGASNKAAVERMLLMRFQELSQNEKFQNLESDAYDALAIAWTAWIVHNKRHDSKAWTEIRT